jgi:hypothetical protein
MEELMFKFATLPTATSVRERNAQELQLLVDALIQKADELGYAISITFNTKEK